MHVMGPEIMDWAFDKMHKVMIFSDGSNYDDDVDNPPIHRAGWAVAILYVIADNFFSFVGYFGGTVELNVQKRFFIGASAENALQSEMSGVFWALFYHMQYCSPFSSGSAVLKHQSETAAPPGGPFWRNLR